MLARALLIAFLSLAAASPVAAQGFFGQLFGSPQRAYPPPPPQPAYGPPGAYRTPPGYYAPGQPPAVRPWQPPPAQRSFFGPGGWFGAPEPVAPPRPARPAEPPLPQVTAVAKEPTARKLLVVGDFLGSALAAGLDTAFADEPKVVVIDKTQGSSGLVRDDRYDWSKEIVTLLNEVRPDFVAVMIGTNDRQTFRSGERGPVRSEPWEAAYRKRLKGFGDALKAYGRPVIWTGMPPMVSANASADMAYLNGLFKGEAEAIGGSFVDIWNGFADADGKFVMRAPDPDGQMRTMRDEDGVNFTRAGRLKLAYYAEREIRRVGNLGADLNALQSSTSLDQKIEVGPKGQKWLVGPVISLTGAPPGAPPVLAGDSLAAAEPRQGSAQYQLVVLGTPAPALKGRFGDFSWSAGDPAAVAVAAEPAAPEPAEATTPPVVPVARPTPSVPVAAVPARPRPPAAPPVPGPAGQQAARPTAPSGTAAAPLAPAAAAPRPSVGSAPQPLGGPQTVAGPSPIQTLQPPLPVGDTPAVTRLRGR